jgi:hypothetical protein
MARRVSDPPEALDAVRAAIAALLEVLPDAFDVET